MFQVEEFDDRGLPETGKDWFVLSSIICMIFLIFIVYKINLMHNNI